jgi:serine phosphatase RsbU (regulator of sigma subunit)
MDFQLGNCGHPSAYVLDHAGNVKVCLESTALPLAVLADVDFPTRGPFVLEPGDVLILIPDGTLQAMDTRGEYFGAKRVLEVVQSNRHLAA